MNVELPDLNERIRRINKESETNAIIRISLYGVFEQIVGALPRYVTYEQYAETLERVLQDYGVERKT